MFATASAPGKVILFGEHAVVHGVTAVAAALSDLRIRVSARLVETATLKLVLEDMLEENGKPVVVEMDWDAIQGVLGEDTSSTTPPCPEVIHTLQGLHGACLQTVSNQVRQSASAFHFLAFRMMHASLKNSASGSRGIEASVSSVGLPLGAGLGSSGAFSVAMAGALINLRAQMETGIHVFTGMDSGSTMTPCADVLAEINLWAFASEVIIHGEPSGLDNTTSCYGGAIRMSKKSSPPFECLKQAPALNILLTNTKVPRSTKVLVAGVKAYLAKYPSVIGPIMDSIEGVSQRFLEIAEREGEAAAAGGGGSLEACLARDYEEISDLMDLNHKLLCILGVSHPSLEQVREVSARHGRTCKLTGAGGGGCAITQLPLADITPGSIDADMKALGFDAFRSRVGGAGVKWHHE
jgi:mevalonate kinase